ncbi:hypothetical protein SAMN04489718_4181 [Actinopolyspora saharensis]|uniref:Uncharacterized protein n=1 Tax=Actinopolyspora saharensis TaxID=995062 RepID=A0A1H1H7D1_9ACTN|nr:hypothetical protein SAMN04489718_4181 [Actinopolyspora saharensis]
MIRSADVVVGRRRDSAAETGGNGRNRWGSVGPAPGTGPADTGFDSGQTPISRRSRSTWPVALTLYFACWILPSASTTNVERITPWTILP